MLEAIYYFIGASYFLLLIFALKRDLRSIINQYFIIFFIGLFLWQVTLHLYFYVDLGSYLLFIGRLNYAAGAIFSIGILGFFHYFPVPSFKVPKWILYLFWITNIFLIFITMATPLIDEMETATANGPVVTLGAWYNFYLYFVFGMPCLTLIVGAIKNFTLKGLDRLRFEYSFWVFVPTMIGFLLSNVVLPIYGYIDQFLWSPLFLYPIALSSFYVIAKYRFLDIRLILARAVAFLVFIFMAAGIYAFSLFLIIQTILRSTIDPVTAGISLFISIFAALSFQPILRWLGKITNRLFYKGYYDREKLLNEVTHVMTQSIELSHMSTDILKLLTKNMSISKGSFLMIENNQVSEFFTHEYKKSSLSNKKFLTFFNNYLNKPSSLIFDELAENSDKKFLRENDISIVIPIRVKSENVAILILGPKLSGEIYNSQDIDFLNILASESGIAIQNAKSYEQIKKFNKELEKRVEERTSELQKSQRRELAKAKDIARLKDEFVFIASHELRTPVTAIKGFLDLITKSSTTLPQDMQENINYMSAATNHLAQLINDLLEISRSEAGTMQIAVQPTNILPIIQSIIDELLPQAKKHQIKINLSIKPNIKPVLVDDKKIKEVIMNLLTNALKYNREKGSIFITLFPIENNMMLEIRDTGYGIPENQQEKIFEKFFRATNEKTGDVLGTGLGLFITRMLVEKMGGKIDFSSVEGKGSTFAILLPETTL